MSKYLKRIWTFQERVHNMRAWDARRETITSEVKCQTSDMEWFVYHCSFPTILVFRAQRGHQHAKAPEIIIKLSDECVRQVFLFIILILFPSMLVSRAQRGHQYTKTREWSLTWRIDYIAKFWVKIFIL